MFSLSYSQCDEGEVILWESCYSIETTTAVFNSESTSGAIPSEICELINLEIIDLEVMWGGTNQVTGEIPNCIGDLSNLTYLNLAWNYSSKPTIMFDGDTAGLRASFKSALILISSCFTVLFIVNSFCIFEVDFLLNWADLSFITY